MYAKMKLDYNYQKRFLPKQAFVRELFIFILKSSNTLLAKNELRSKLQRLSLRIPAQILILI